VIDECLAAEAGAALEIQPHTAAEPGGEGPAVTSTGAGSDAAAASSQPRGAATGPWSLTVREREVAALIARGLTSREIAERLVIAERTADSHAEHIRQKLDLHSRVQIAAWAVAHGLVADD
jgi:DNA-binding CsgD family transcriptional regulator